MNIQENFLCNSKKMATKRYAEDQRQPGKRRRYYEREKLEEQKIKLHDRLFVDFSLIVKYKVTKNDSCNCELHKTVDIWLEEIIKKIPFEMTPDWLNNPIALYTFSFENQSSCGARFLYQALEFNIIIDKELQGQDGNDKFITVYNNYIEQLTQF